MQLIAKRQKDVTWYTVPRTEEDRKVLAYWEALEASMPQEDQAVIELRKTLAKRRQRREAISTTIQGAVGLIVAGAVIFFSIGGLH